MHDVSLIRLPSFHIGRPRLTARCSEVRVVVVEAAGGYGKSVLAAELVDAWGTVPVWVALEEGGVSARLLSARLRAAVSRAGLRDAAGLMAGAGDDPAGVVDAMLAGIADESCAIVIDDAHHADRDAASVIERIADQAGGSQRVIVLARHLPAGLARLRRAGVAQLTAGELALRPEETLELCRTGFGLEVSVEDTRALDRATGGWTAAAVLAASRSKHAATPLGALARLGERTDAIQAILEEALSAFGRDRALFAQIAVAPLLDRELLALITGEDGFLERALAWGLPMTRAHDGWWVLPDPVREHLATLATVDPSVLHTVAAHYERCGELDMALQVLLGAGQLGAAARLLDGADPWLIDRIDALELVAVSDRIGDEVLERFPRAMLNVARCCAAGWMFAHSSRLLTRLDALVSEREAPELRRAVDVELLTELLNRGDPARVELLGRRLLDEVCAGEELTRARALTLVGQGLSWRRDRDGRLPAAGLREAADYLQRATELHLALGNRPAAATLTLYRAIWVELALGQPLAALAALDSGSAWAADHPRRLVRIRFFRAYVLSELGREAETEDELSEVVALATRLGDRWMLWYVDMQRMVSASLRGDAEATVDHARRAEAQHGNWWEVEGALFHAEAADCLDRVGHVALAADHLERAKRDPQNAGAQIAMSECALLARHGDAELAQARLSVVDRCGIAPREYWRVTLLTAYAALRLGDRSAGGLAARACEQAAALGQPQLPLLRERELTESLLALAVATGLPAARALEAFDVPGALAVLGRFELTRGGREVRLGNGQERRLLKLVAVKGGQIHVEHAIEALWPEVEPAAGRNRLRTVLNRLRDAAGDVVVREAARLELSPQVRLDLAQFHSEARDAQALGLGEPTAALALAHAAIARYRGPLLPFDPYEPWTEEPRERARQTMLDLLDLCAEAAAGQSDLDEARRMVQRAIELDPYDEDRYLKVAQILHLQGRKGAALSVLRRARAALAQLGIDPPSPLVEFERTIAAADVKQVDVRTP